MKKTSKHKQNWLIHAKHRAVPCGKSTFAATSNSVTITALATASSVTTIKAQHIEAEVLSVSTTASVPQSVFYKRGRSKILTTRN